MPPQNPCRAGGFSLPTSLLLPSGLFQRYDRIIAVLFSLLCVHFHQKTDGMCVSVTLAKLNSFSLVKHSIRLVPVPYVLSRQMTATPAEKEKGKRKKEKVKSFLGMITQPSNSHRKLKSTLRNRNTITHYLISQTLLILTFCLLPFSFFLVA